MQTTPPHIHQPEKVQDISRKPVRRDVTIATITSSLEQRVTHHRKVQDISRKPAQPDITVEQ